MSSTSLIWITLLHHKQFVSEILASHTAFERGEEAVNVEQAQLRVAEESVDALIVVPVGFEDSIGTFTPVSITYYSNKDSFGGVIQQTVAGTITRWNSVTIATQTGQIVVNALGADVETEDIYRRAQGFVAQEQVNFDVELTGADGELQPGEGFGHSVPGFGSMFVMFTVFGGMATLLRERQQWTMQRMIVMPLTRSQILGGKILTYFILGMVQFVILFAFGALMGLPLYTNLVGLMMIMVSYTLAITALSFALASSIRTEGQANNLTTLLAISLAALGGAWWSLDVVPDVMRHIGHLSPVAWAMDAFNVLIFFDGSVVDILPYTAVLLGFALVLFVIGVRRFKYA